MNYFYLNLLVVYNSILFFHIIHGTEIGQNRISCNQSENLGFCQLKSCLLENNIINIEQILIERNYDISSAYHTLNYQWNQIGGNDSIIYPIGYLVPDSILQIQTTIKCSHAINGGSQRLRLVPKGGGHSYAKYSFGDSINTIVIDLQKLVSININPSAKEVEVGPGWLLGPLLHKLATRQLDGSFGIPFGTCPSVGIGFVLGGGYSEFSRLHGMAVDSLIEVRMINVHGNLVTASAQVNPDLFWALRGGGSGSFGIIVSFKFKMFSAPHAVVEGTSEYNLASFPALFAEWQKLLGSNPLNKLNAVMRIFPSKDQVWLKVIELQSTAVESISIGNSNILKVLANFPTSNKTTKSGTSISGWSYLDYVYRSGYQEVGGLANFNLNSTSSLQFITRHDFHPKDPLLAKTFYTKQLIDSEQIHELYSLLLVAPLNVRFALRAMGGAIDDVEPHATAFVHRNHYYELDMYLGGSVAEQVEGMPWMNIFFNLTKTMMGHEESYQNHIDINLDDYLQRYYGGNLERLIAIKRKYDPTNFFYNPQSVPVRMP